MRSAHIGAIAASSQQQVGGGSGAADPYFSAVRLLLHFDGPDESTTFTDSSSSPHTATKTGSPEIDTAQSRFGGASLLLSGSDYLTFTENSTDEFYFSRPGVNNNVSTVETHFRLAEGALDGTRAPAIWVAGSSELQYLMMFVSAASELTFRVSYFGSTDFPLGEVSEEQWYHLALRSDWSDGGDQLVVFLDGVPMYAGAAAWGRDQMAVGANPYSLANSYFAGHIDEFRFTNAAAADRYGSSGFTPPSAPYPNS